MSPSRTDYDEDGWRYMRRRMVETVQSIVDAVEHGVEPRCSGEDLRRPLDWQKDACRVYYRAVVGHVSWSDEFLKEGVRCWVLGARGSYLNT